MAEQAAPSYQYVDVTSLGLMERLFDPIVEREAAAVPGLIGPSSAKAAGTARASSARPALKQKLLLINH
jgi:hypothetical protein